MSQVRKFKDRLNQDLKNKKFKTAFDEEDIFARLAVEIAKVREASGLSQQELATQLRTTQQTISRLENPRNRSFSLNTLVKIARALHKNIEIHFV